jgi:hypothetical protein
MTITMRSALSFSMGKVGDLLKIIKYQLSIQKQLSHLIRDNTNGKK